MARLTQEEIRAFKSNLKTMLRNRLTYPKVAVSLATQRPLTEDEVTKINQCFEQSIGLVEAELTIILWKLTEVYVD